jgi:hypothetical protein
MSGAAVLVVSVTPLSVLPASLSWPESRVTVDGLVLEPESLLLDVGKLVAELVALLESGVSDVADES